MEGKNTPLIKAPQIRTDSSFGMEGQNLSDQKIIFAPLNNSF
jgi:hypothetical protein